MACNQLGDATATQLCEPAYNRRWQNLNRSLERVSAVHDGDGAAAASAAAEAAPAGDSAGIALDAVRDVGGGLGWGCTQALPQQSSSQPDTPDAPVPVGICPCYTWLCPS